MLINKAFGGKTPGFLNGSNYLLFIGLMAISFVVTALFQNYMVSSTNNIMFDLELSVIQKVRNASFEGFEALGSERVYTAINDTRVLGRIPQTLVGLVNSSFTIICSLSYLFFISTFGCLTIILIMTALLSFYLYRNKSIRKDLNKVRDLQDAYYVSLRELLAGFKQIRISTKRNTNLFERFILENKKKTKDLTIKTARKYVTNELVGTYSWYMVLGIVIFLLPAFFKIDRVQVAGFITTILFMMSSVSQLIQFFPYYTSLKISIERIRKVDRQLGVAGHKKSQERKKEPVTDFSTIRFEDVVYKYGDSDKTMFQLELPELRINRGEIIFIEGANGSGKTTFINVLTGLCKPTSGRIFLDDNEIEWEDFCSFSNSMAVVYTNQHLFRENYDDHDLSEDNRLIPDLTDLFNLNGVFRIDRNKNRWDIKLSKGQEKRVSLLLALLEEKPIIILDEWAAEQDPANRRCFYLKWLEEMRSMGKTIIAISHDDDFYHVADRVIKFDYGKMASISNGVSKIGETVPE